VGTIRARLGTHLLVGASCVLGLGQTTRAQEPRNAQPPQQVATVTQKSEPVPPTSSDAIRKARAVLGLPARVQVESEANIVVLETDDTPFLSAQLIGRPIWHVVLRDVHVEIASTADGTRDRYYRIFDVYLDEGVSRVLKITSRWPEGVAPILPPPAAESATAKLKASGGEVWHGFPDNGPETTLLQALDEVQREGGGSIMSTPQIIAHYVLMSRATTPEPKAVWSIHLRGIPPFETMGPGSVSKHLRNHMRSVVGDATGKWLFMTTSPQPDIPPGFDLEADDTPASGSGSEASGKGKQK
jgi:hypothetical protein